MVHPEINLAEASVLGSILLEPKCIGPVLADLRPEDFAGDTAPEMFRALRALYLEGATIDPVTVLARMGNSPQHRDFVLSVMDLTLTAANVTEYTKVVKDQAQLRSIQATGLALASTGVDLDQARGLIGQLEQLLAGRETVDIMTMEQGLLAFGVEMDRKPEYLKWGLDFLDLGLTAEAGDFVVLGGYPSDGKTALALSMAYEQARSKRVGFFSLETSASKLFARLCATVAQVPSSRIKRRDLSPDDYELLAIKSDEMRARNLDLIRCGAMSVEDITAVAKSRQYDVIYIDYLTLIQAQGRTEYEQTTATSKALHRFAQSAKTTVVALSQLSRPVQGGAKIPTLSSLRSSGQVEQDADVVMLLYREEPDNLRSRRILRVAKNKEGLTGQIVLDFDGDTQRFRPSIDQTAKKPPAQRREPKDKQMSFEELTGADPELPF